MADTLDYIRKYGNFTFDELPFNEVDNAVLCEIFYMAMEKVSPQTFDERKSFRDVAYDLFSYNGNKHKAPGLILMKKISRKMMVAANTKRFGSLMVTGAVEVYKERPAVQFCAATFILPDDTKVVVFRGTDDSLVGWVEDLYIYTRHSIPSYQLSVDYLDRVHNTFPEGDIIICGHSKGGNVALYAALASSKAIRDRIKYLFNNDGPGFDSYAWFSTPAYKELLPKYRHFVPTSSLVGMLLAHDNDYEVIKNKRLTGMLQHDLSAWKTKEIGLSKAKGLNILGMFTDTFLNKIVFGVGSEQMGAFDKICESVLLDGVASKAPNLSDLPRNLGGAIKGATSVWSNSDEDDKDIFRSCFVDTTGKVKDAMAETREEYVETRIENRRAKRSAKGEEEAGFIDRMNERIDTIVEGRINKKGEPSVRSEVALA